MANHICMRGDISLVSHTLSVCRRKIYCALYVGACVFGRGVRVRIHRFPAKRDTSRTPSSVCPAPFAVVALGACCQPSFPAGPLCVVRRCVRFFIMFWRSICSVASLPTISVLRFGLYAACCCSIVRTSSGSWPLPSGRGCRRRIAADFSTMSPVLQPPARCFVPCCFMRL